ncbi:TniQ family protein [Methyloversatilis sp.]|uniref:TniQ family protein n=1 Tax=Methyloversatilis sp. TaxID=2569862 RepID=UPI0027337E26|nr:TniQ family protein [Methyloversatilis sp.]MDP3456642.1 TniQ family protein [Methyloversatilis sp.]
MNYLPLPIEGESPLSVVLRMAEMNGYSSARKFVDLLIKRPSYSILFRKGNFARKMSELYPEKIRNRLLAGFFEERPSVSSRKPVRVLNVNFPAGAVRSYSQAVCPDCAKEGYYRAENSVALFVFCAKHGRKLVGSCPTCEKSFGPGQRGIDQCQCKAPISNIESPRGFAFGERVLFEAMTRGDQQRVSQMLAYVTVLEIERETDLVKRSRLLGYAALLAVAPTRGVRAFARHQQRRYPELLPRVALARLISSVSPASDLAEQLARTVSREVKITLVPREQMNAPTWPTQSAERTSPAQAPTTADSENLLLLLDSRAASAALNVSTHSLTALERAGLLKLIRRNSIIRHRYGSHEVSGLMLRLAQGRAEGALGEGDQFRTRAYAEELVEIFAGRRQVVKFDIESGLPSLKTIASPAASAANGSTSGPRPTDLLSLEETAERLSTYADAIRRIEKAGHLTRHVSANAQGRQPLTFTSEEVQRFDRVYIFVGNLATQLSTGATSLSDRLAAVGVSPISGPRIDGALVNVFRRADLLDVDLQKVKALKNYPTRTGRKVAGVVRYDKKRWLTSTEAAELLGITVQQIAALQRSALLVSDTPPDREADNRDYFLRTDVEKTRCELDAMIDIDTAAAQVGLTRREFVVRFIESGFVQCVSVWKKQRIRRVDLQRIQENLVKYLSAAQAGEILGTHSRYLMNAERAGRILRVPEHECGMKGAALFRREDVLALKDGPEIESQRRGVSKRMMG